MGVKGIDRRQFIESGLALLAGTRWVGLSLGTAAGPLNEPIATGPFIPDLHSLGEYRAPEWFRNAKFGMSAQWTPQSVPERGDWYARNMYIQGSAQYNYHVAHYGHPSKFGYKDICHRWKGERWDPEGLIDLYKKAGAKYFVALANHHDGFDCWDSSFQPWNSVNIGPNRDIVGTWAGIVRQCGLRFGLAVFSTPNWQWFNVSHGSDKTGPLKGVLYDGNLTKVDGLGKWWDGYDPQMLYGPPHADGEPPSAEYIQNFFNRTKELIDKYRPDQVFFTDNGLPLGDTGLRLAAHFYNASFLWHGKEIDAVINTKNVPPDLQNGLVWDRLPPEEIAPFAWQMDICIGDWHYKRDITYRSAAEVVPYLVDVVSKNGNLLLNIPVKADGSIDERELSFLGQITDWMKVNGEAIFDTRPWKVFGEGPTHAPAVDFPYVKVRYTAKDIRFTAKGATLYAIALDWPSDGVLVIKSLARPSPYLDGEVASVLLLGSEARLKWTRNEGGLAITLPAGKVCDYAYSFKIRLQST